MRRQITKLIILGLVMLLAGIALLVQPYYTLAVEDDHPCRITVDPPDLLFKLENLNPGDRVERSLTVTKVGESPANLYLTWEWVDGNPLPGQRGSLYEQLEMIVVCEGKEIYRGPMTGLIFPLNISRLLGKVIEYGDVYEFDFTIRLPGLETRNEFQGSSMVAELVFYTVCFDEIIVPPDDPGTDPDDDPDEDPDDDEDPKKEKKVPPEKPKQTPLTRSGGIPLVLIFGGTAMIVTGFVLKRKYCL